MTPADITASGTYTSEPYVLVPGRKIVFNRSLLTETNNWNVWENAEEFPNIGTLLELRTALERTRETDCAHAVSDQLFETQTELVKSLLKVFSSWSIAKKYNHLAKLNEVTLSGHVYQPLFWAAINRLNEKYGTIAEIYDYVHEFPAVVSYGLQKFFRMALKPDMSLLKFKTQPPDMTRHPCLILCEEAKIKPSFYDTNFCKSAVMAALIWKQYQFAVSIKGKSDSGLPAVPFVCCHGEIFEVYGLSFTKSSGWQCDIARVYSGKCDSNEGVIDILRVIDNLVDYLDSSFSEYWDTDFVKGLPSKYFKLPLVQSERSNASGSRFSGRGPSERTAQGSSSLRHSSSALQNNDEEEYFKSCADDIMIRHGLQPANSCPASGKGRFYFDRNRFARRCWFPEQKRFVYLKGALTRHGNIDHEREMLNALAETTMAIPKVLIAGKIHDISYIVVSDVGPSASSISVGNMAAWREVAARLLQNVSIMHKHNIIHGDISDANVCIQLVDGKHDVALIDFEQAGEMDEQGKTKMAYGCHGRKGFVAPEDQVYKVNRNSHLTVQSDLYSVGKVLEHVAAPSVARNQDVRRIVKWLTAEEPANRPKTAEEVLDDNFFSLK